MHCFTLNSVLSFRRYLNKKPDEEDLSSAVELEEEEDQAYAEDEDSDSVTLRRRRLAAAAERRMQRQTDLPLWDKLHPSACIQQRPPLILAGAKSFDRKKPSWFHPP